jgi:hypothetical protein
VRRSADFGIKTDAISGDIFKFLFGFGAVGTIAIIFNLLLRDRIAVIIRIFLGLELTLIHSGPNDLRSRRDRGGHFERKTRHARWASGRPFLKQKDA